MKLKLLLFFLLALTMIKAQGNNDWVTLKYFTGNWKGHETGRAGIGKGERTYEFIMDGTYLYAKNTSRFEPQEKNPKGEVHQDWGFFSRDESRNLIVLREFHSEGFVNQYILDTLNSNDKKLIFISESSENAPPGLRARLTFDIKNESEFTETFELAFPGKEFSEWLKNYWIKE